MESSYESNVEAEVRINSELEDAITSGRSVSATLMTDERVFARITDGIYRDPASAIRELIANAYDADATEVRVETDCPRFSKISVRDNGRGLTKETLAHVICHIGGSLKRTKDGQKHQISSEDDPTKSRAGRPLIGKLGIGLFSVSQITHHVVIISKTKGSKKRIYCDMLLMPQSEAILEKEDGQKFVTGKVNVKFIDAEDEDYQGTEIILLDLREHVREALLSKLTWTSIREQRNKDKNEDEDGLEDIFAEEEYGGNFSVKEPIYHIGEIDVDSGSVLTPENLPWKNSAPAELKFFSLVEKVSEISDPDRSSKGPSIQEHLDYYLRMLWVLSLSLPVPYIKKHPFRLSNADNISLYQIDNKAKGSAVEISLPDGVSIVDKYPLKSTIEHDLPFDVYVDNVLLFRPLQYGNFSSIDHAISKPLLFIGRAKPDLSDVPEKYRGGDLEFEAYLYWNKKVVPREHNGVLIRINGASGTLFDENFLKYQISELTRLRQITAEIFVVKGLDAALNIDRESFNIAHPHYLILKNWLHSALRQLMNRHKYLSQDVNKERLQSKKLETFTSLSEIVIRRSSEVGNKAAKSVSYVKDGSVDELFGSAEKKGMELSADRALAPLAAEKPVTAKDRLKKALNEEKAKSLASILSLYGIDEFLPKSEFENLISAILEIMILEIKK
ncbi:MAG: ATP-binding protein [Gammaproteobacteria bacterium HGW-Gammaproteobacteria-9]|nr:MAG: ATP-binding protein [Gammaproteobacteria bacterium HGW-Gammaproteobacteria-9]